MSTDKHTFRAGNFLQDKRTKNLGIVTKVKKNITAIMETTTLTQPLEEWEGVPLTEEILEQLGFEANTFNDIYWISPSFIIDINSSGGKTEFHHFDLKIESVHELQNAYSDYAGGRELKYKVRVTKH